MEAQVGIRVAEHWLAGIEIGGIGLYPSNDNSKPDDLYSSIYAQSLSSAFLVANYVPHQDRGWYAGAGAGVVVYDTKNPITKTDVRSGDGWGALCRVGYDWTFGQHGRFGVDLNCQFGHVNLVSPYSGSIGLSVIALDLHLTYR